MFRALVTPRLLRNTNMMVLSTRWQQFSAKSTNGMPPVPGGYYRGYFDRENAMKMPTVLVVLMMAATGWADEWVGFRGPNGRGISDTTGLPVEFGPSKNVVWRRSPAFCSGPSALLR
jgi:hypothetical protein